MIFYLCLVPWPWSNDLVLTRFIQTALLGLAGREAWIGSIWLEGWQSSQLKASLGTAGGILFGFLIWQLKGSQGYPLGLGFIANRGLEAWYVLMGLLGVVGYVLASEPRPAQTDSQGLSQHRGLYAGCMLAICLLGATGLIKTPIGIVMVLLLLGSLASLGIQANFRSAQPGLDSKPEIPPPVKEAQV